MNKINIINNHEMAMHAVIDSIEWTSHTSISLLYRMTFSYATCQFEKEMFSFHIFVPWELLDPLPPVPWLVFEDFFAW